MGGDAVKKKTVYYSCHVSRYRVLACSVITQSHRRNLKFDGVENSPEGGQSLGRSQMDVRAFKPDRGAWRVGADLRGEAAQQVGDALGPFGRVGV